MKKSLFICILLALCGSVAAQDITGKWYGKLEVKQLVMRLVFHIEKNDNGFKCTMDYPDGKVYDMRVETIKWEEGKLTLESRMMGMVYEGKLNDKGEFEGTFKQENITLPLILSRTEGKAPRPQEPREPFPYKVEDVKFHNAKDKVELAGTLTLPGEGTGFPVVILVSGNGPHNRDGEIEGHKPFAVLADFLTRMGIGVLRVDDRGTGLSTGNFVESDLHDFARDVEAGIAYLKERGWKQVGLIGHGSGGAIASLAARQAGGISCIVLLASAGIRGDKLVPLQLSLIQNASGLDVNSVTKGETTNRELLKHLAECDDPEAEKGWVRDYLSRLYRETPALALYGSEKNYVERQLSRIYIPEFLSIVRYDPVQTLRNVKCPVLALYGEKDLVFPADINGKAMRKILTKSRDERSRVKTFPGMNYLFQESFSGLPDEYVMIEQTMSPAVMGEVGDWIREVMNMDKK